MKMGTRKKLWWLDRPTTTSSRLAKKSFKQVFQLKFYVGWTWMHLILDDFYRISDKSSS